ncbi:MAG: SDR family oxidoreductase [Candidatus Thermoplasmatota archaeon]|jgi:3-oxoacyl-[acyl-carrier protein] reductase|nr:SDR family oxidoreductase [Candidatus Thermoplasmatota archaeon]MCL5790018.1 SDR family oxidoreductase [Candidatus Thermoplasmatota archaeon]
MRGLEGKVAIVTAASSGIGKGIAKVLSSEGCIVHISSRDRAKLEKSAEEIRKETGKQVNAVPCDLTRPADVTRMLSEVKKKSGKVDFLVINFGDPKVAPFLEITDEDWDSSMNMFLKSSVTMIRSILPEMISNGDGRVVFVTSLTTKQALENFSISASLRAAVVSLSKVLSIEYAKNGITFNSISQGYIMTPRLESIARRNAEKMNISLDQAYDAIRQGIPARRFGKPEEIGHLVSFLCSSDASYINGANIQIDGGVVRFPL